MLGPYKVLSVPPHPSKLPAKFEVFSDTDSDTLQDRLKNAADAVRNGEDLLDNLQFIYFCSTKRALLVYQLGILENISNLLDPSMIDLEIAEIVLCIFISITNQELPSESPLSMSCFLENLLDFLYKSSSDLQLLSLRILYQLAIDINNSDRVCDFLVSSRFFRFLYECLPSSPQFCIYSLHILSLSALRLGPSKSSVLIDLIPKVLSIISNDSLADTHSLCFESLSSLIKNADNLKVAKDGSLIQLLFHRAALFHDESIPFVFECIAETAEKEDFDPMFLTDQFIENLSTLLLTFKCGERLPIFRVLDMLAFDHAKLLIEKEVVWDLFQFSPNSNINEKKYSVWILFHVAFSSDRENAIRIFTNRGSHSMWETFLCYGEEKQTIVLNSLAERIESEPEFGIFIGSLKPAIESLNALKESASAEISEMSASIIRILNSLAIRKTEADEYS